MQRHRHTGAAAGDGDDLSSDAVDDREGGNDDASATSAASATPSSSSSPLPPSAGSRSRKNAAGAAMVGKEGGREGGVAPAAAAAAAAAAAGAAAGARPLWRKPSLTLEVLPSSDNLHTESAPTPGDPTDHTTTNAQPAGSVPKGVGTEGSENRHSSVHRIEPEPKNLVLEENQHTSTSAATAAAAALSLAQIAASDPRAKRNAFGNDLADKAANTARTSLQPALTNVQEAKRYTWQAYHALVTVKVIAAVLPLWPRLEKGSRIAKEHASEILPAQTHTVKLQPAPRLKHDWTQAADRWHCPRCLAFVRGTSLPESRKKQWCPGHADIPDKDVNGHILGHRIFNGEPLTYCKTCGAWATFKTKGKLTKPCSGVSTLVVYSSRKRPSICCAT